MAASTHHDKKSMTEKSSTSPSSQGDSPVEMTPLDASPENATWKDRTQRNLQSDDAEERADALLDEASDLSFPASDPIAVNSITRIEKKAKDGKQGKAQK